MFAVKQLTAAPKAPWVPRPPSPRVQPKFSLSAAGLSPNAHDVPDVCWDEEPMAWRKDRFRTKRRKRVSSSCILWMWVKVFEPRTQLSSTWAGDFSEFNPFYTHSLNWLMTANYTGLNSGHALSETLEKLVLHAQESQLGTTRQL